MIISHKYKFIFIKTRKTAGTSIEVFLSQHCDERDILTPIEPPIEPHVARNYRGLWNPCPEIIMNKGQRLKKTIRSLRRRGKFYHHIPARLIRTRVPKKIWNSYFKFCVDRNPWDKTLSHYYMKNFRSGGNLLLEEYLQRDDFNICINFPMYTDNNNLLVDKVVKYENFVEDLGKVFKELNIPFEGTLNIKAKSEYRSSRKPYQQVFSEEQKEIIGRAFEQEIVMHGYKY